MGNRLVVEKVTSEHIEEFREKLQEMLDKYLLEPSDDLAEKMNALRAEIEACGYTTVLVAYEDKEGYLERFQAKVVPQDNSLNRH